MTVSRRVLGVGAVVSALLMAVVHPSMAQAASGTAAAVSPVVAAAPADAALLEEVDASIWTPAGSAVGNEAPATNAPRQSWSPDEAGEVSRGSEAMRAPAGTVAAAPGIGELPYFAFQDFPLSPDTTARVNVANGNLLVASADQEVVAPGLGLRADRFYNGLSTLVGAHGGGWFNSNAAQNVGLDIQPSFVDFYAPNGAVLRFTPAGGGVFTAPAGSNMTLTQAGGSYTVTLNRSGEVYSFSSAGWLTRAADRNDVGVSLAYASGAMIQITHDNGRFIKYHWASGVLNQLEDSAGRKTNFTYVSGRLSTVTTPHGETTTYTYDSTGRLATIQLPSADGQPNTTVQFGYDASHRVTSVSQATRSAAFGVSPALVTGFAYGSGQTQVTDPNSNVSTIFFDSSGRQTSATDPLGHTRSQSWSANSDVTTRTDAAAGGGAVTTYTFDGDGNQTGATLPTGAAASAVYTAAAGCGSGGDAFQVKCATDDAGNTKSMDYDAAGNQTKQTDTTGTTPVVEFERTYDDSSRSVCGGFAGQVCTAKDGNGNTTTYAYNTAGDLLSVTPPAPAGATTYTYDAMGRVKTVTDGNSDTTTYDYDLRDNIVKTTYDDASFVLETYFGNDLPKQRTEAGRTIFWEHDSQNRLTKIIGPAASTSTLYKHDKTGNLLETTDPGGLVTKYRYNAANQLDAITLPGGTCTAGTAAPAAGSGCVKIANDSNGNEISRTFPGGVTQTTTRDASTRPTRIATQAGGTVHVDTGYSYTTPAAQDRAMIQTRTAHKEEGLTAGAVTTYSYDSRNRLTKAEEKAAATVTASWAYGYDNNSNRTQQTRVGSTGAAAGTITYGYDAANRVTSATGSTTTWTYDGAGNQTKNGLTGHPTTYNNRLAASAINGVTQEYFGGGNTWRTNTGSTTVTDSALGVTDYTTGGAATKIIRDPQGAPVASLTGTSGVFYLTDHLGSVTGLLDRASGAYRGGYTYSPYGEARTTGTHATVTANTLRYIGERHDGNGIYKLGARYYDTGLGRFTQTDPSGQELNPYAYAACDPINGSDPTGLDVQCSIAIGLVGVAHATTWGAAVGTLVAPGIGTAIGAALSVAWVVAGAFACA